MWAKAMSIDLLSKLVILGACEAKCNVNLILDEANPEVMPILKFNGNLIPT